MRVGLIDADLLCFTAAVIGQRTVDLGFDDGDVTLLNKDDALSYIRETLAEWREAVGVDDWRFCWSDADRTQNWRLKMLPSYKHNRTGDKPQLYWELRAQQLCEAPARNVVLPGLEGDDVLGILQTGPFGKRHDTVIITGDKDLWTVPGELYDFRRSEHTIVTPEQAAHFHMTQTLTGDPVDGYHGLVGCGKTKAAKLLKGLTTYEEMWPVVVKAYVGANFTEAHALVQARVARILRRDNWDAEARAVLLWEPPG